jgi:hypothetical protein
MTRLHLRMGSLELARAELEALAGAGQLDTESLIDLAEVRWRTGDLPGAGVAANAYLAAERDETLALVIAAEASAAAGHPGEAGSRRAVLGGTTRPRRGVRRRARGCGAFHRRTGPVTDLFPALRPMREPGRRRRGRDAGA